MKEKIVNIEHHVVKINGAAAKTRGSCGENKEQYYWIRCPDRKFPQSK